MKVKGLRIICDCCGRVDYIPDEDEMPRHMFDINKAPTWKFGTEIGDLCPTCTSQWEDYKTTFVTQRRKESNADLI